MDPINNVLYSMDSCELSKVFESISTKGLDVQFCIAGQIFSGQSSDPIILQNLRALLTCVNELGLNEVHREPITKVKALCSDLLVRSESNALTEFEIDLAKAKAGEYLPAYNRLALFICLRQNDKLFSDAVDIASKSDPFSGSFLYLAEKNSVALLTLKEMAVLYAEFIRAIDKLLFKRNSKLGPGQPSFNLETMSINWYVDYYRPDNELADIMVAGFESITNARKAVNGPKPALGFGLGYKCFYTVEKGCAMFQDNIIGHDGKLLKEDPWKTFYFTGDINDEKRAKELCPKMSQKMKTLFENRKIATAMGYVLAENATEAAATVTTLGYKFSKNATLLSRAEHWEVVKHLIKLEDGHISQKVGFKVLLYAMCAKRWDIYQALFQAGLPIYDTDRDDDDLFGDMIMKCDSSEQFIKILKEVKVPKGSHDTFKKITWSLYIRYRDNDINSEEEVAFSLLTDLWITSKYPEYERIDDIPEDARKASTTDFYKAIVYHLDNLKEKFKNAEFEQKIRDQSESL